MNNQETDFIIWSSWFQWILANLLAGVLAVYIVRVGALFLIASLVGGLFGIIIALVIMPITFGLAGFTIGIMQWAFLQRWVNWAKQWILPSSIVWALVGGVPFVIEMTGLNVNIVILTAIIGSAVGVIQWFVLSRQVNQAGWWILFSSIGLVIAVIVSARIVGWGKDFHFFYTLLNGGSGNSPLLFGIIAGAVYGAITGLTLISLLKYANRKVQTQSSLPSHLPE
ncbi:MAG: hypothetical protein GY808_02440, partial [Gammaproteobacteria bacterium]|nr:hypothetical protein [Gammaproteobacteria bacterium]